MVNTFTWSCLYKSSRGHLDPSFNGDNGFWLWIFERVAALSCGVSWRVEIIWFDVSLLMGVARVQAHFLFGPWASLETTIFCPQNHTAPNSSKIYVGLGYRHLNVRKDKIMDLSPTILLVFFFYKRVSTYGVRS